MNFVLKMMDSVLNMMILMQTSREWHTEVTEAAAAVGAQYEEYRAE